MEKEPDHYKVSSLRQSVANFWTLLDKVQGIEELHGHWGKVQVKMREIKHLSLKIRDLILQDMLEEIFTEGISMSICKRESYEAQAISIRFLKKLLSMVSRPMALARLDVISKESAGNQLMGQFLKGALTIRQSNNDERHFLNQLNELEGRNSAVASIPLGSISWRQAHGKEVECVKDQNIWVDFNYRSLSIALMIKEESVVLEVNYDSISDWQRNEEEILLYLSGALGREMILRPRCKKDLLRMSILFRERGGLQIEEKSSRCLVPLSLEFSRPCDYHQTPTIMPLGHEEKLSKELDSKTTCEEVFQIDEDSSIILQQAHQPKPFNLAYYIPDLPLFSKKMTRVCNKFMSKYLKIRRSQLKRVNRLLQTL